MPAAACAKGKLCPQRNKMIIKERRRFCDSCALDAGARGRLLDMLKREGYTGDCYIYPPEAEEEEVAMEEGGCRCERKEEEGETELVQGPDPGPVGEGKVVIDPDELDGFDELLDLAELKDEGESSDGVDGGVDVLKSCKPFLMSSKELQLRKIDMLLAELSRLMYLYEDVWEWDGEEFCI